MLRGRTDARGTAVYFLIKWSYHLGGGKSRGAAIYILNESLMLFRNTADPRRRRALEPRGR